MAGPDTLRGGSGDGAPTVDVPEVPVPAPARTVPEGIGRSGWRRHRSLIAVAALGSGAALTWVGATGAPSLPTSRPATAVLGVVLLLVGIDSVLKRLVGEQVRTATVLSVAWLVVLVSGAVFADLLPLSEARDSALTVMEPPLERPDLFSAHPLGTDRQSLDLLGGVLYGARVSLVVGIGAATIGLLVGGLLGMVAGYYRGRVEAAIDLGTDALIAFPPLILLLALVAVLEPSVRNVTIGLAILGIPVYVRLAKANTLRLVQRDFVRMARALGGTDRRIIFRELLPNVVAPLVSYAFVVVAVLIVAEASLSYLGLSIQRPDPTWGNLIAAGEDSFDQNPHLVAGPGAALFLTVFALNRASEAARARWEIHRR